MTERTYSVTIDGEAMTLATTAQLEPGAHAITTSTGASRSVRVEREIKPDPFRGEWVETVLMAKPHPCITRHHDLISPWLYRVAERRKRRQERLQ